MAVPTTSQPTCLSRPAHTRLKRKKPPSTCYMISLFFSRNFRTYDTSRGVTLRHARQKKTRKKKTTVPSARPHKADQNNARELGFRGRELLCQIIRDTCTLFRTLEKTNYPHSLETTNQPTNRPTKRTRAKVRAGRNEAERARGPGIDVVMVVVSRTDRAGGLADAGKSCPSFGRGGAGSSQGG